jgi:hypothetical protein
VFHLFRESCSSLYQRVETGDPGLLKVNRQPIHSATPFGFYVPAHFLKNVVHLNIFSQNIGSQSF